MKFRATDISEVMIVEPEVFGDQRGFFLESWHAGKFAAAGLEVTFVQDNHSRSRQGVLRGLHYQLVRPQGKLVRVVVGEIFDVAVDLRRGSATFGHWVGVVLSAANHRMLWVPPGFAHGFYVISPVAETIYKCSDFYDPAGERSLRWDDPELAIDWPLPAGEKPLVSPRDEAASLLAVAEVYP